MKNIGLSLVYFIQSPGLVLGEHQLLKMNWKVFIAHLSSGRVVYYGCSIFF